MPVSPNKQKGKHPSRKSAHHDRQPEKAGSDSLEELTPRQRETLCLIVEGLSTNEVASKLGVSVKTVETHRAQLKQRLGIYNAVGLVRYAIRKGMISAD